MSSKSRSATAISLDLRLRISGSRKVTLGPGKVRLLTLLAETGSIGEAAKRMNMSYMRAWSMIQTMKPLVTSSRGGKGGGGAQLTELGQQTVQLYQRMESAARKAIGADWDAMQRLFVP